MRREATRQLDRIDQLRVGQGMLEAYAFGSGDFDSGSVGGALDYSHRVSESVSLFANGSLGYGWGIAPGLGWRAGAGLRGHFE